MLQSLPVDPSQCALLIMDYQPLVLDLVSDGDKLVERANEAIGIVRRRSVTVGFVRVAFSDDDYAIVPATNRAFSSVAAGRQLHVSAAATAIHPDLAVRPGDIVVRKTRVSAFSTTNLDEQLTNLGVTTLILAGLTTSGVVLSTVRDAADRDYRLVLLSDCVSDPSQELHAVLMEQVFPGQADIITTAGLHSLLAEAA
jgi:nicotinamidase-related amidase